MLLPIVTIVLVASATLHREQVTARLYASLAALTSVRHSFSLAE